MMILTDRRRFPVLFSAIAALALAGAVLKEKGKMNEFANILRTVPGKRTVPILARPLPIFPSHHIRHSLAYGPSS